MRLHEFFLSLSQTKSLGFRIWQVIILLIRSVSLLSFLILFLKYYEYFEMKTFYGHLLLGYASLEVCFFVYYKVMRHRLQQLKPLPHRCQTSEERRELVLQCLSTFRPAPPDNREKPNPYIRIAIEKWFLGSPLEHISQQDFKKWCAWAFFNAELENMSLSEQNELNAHIDWFQKSIEYEFPTKIPESATQTSSIRLSLDPVIDTHRPFIYYLVISIINLFGKTVVSMLGFKQVEARPLRNGLMYRPASSSSSSSSSSTASDTIGEDKQGLPVVFIHGIGIGFAHYLLILFKLPRDVPVILVEWPHVSMQIVEDIPTIQETVQALSHFLDKVYEERTKLEKQRSTTTSSYLADAGAVFVGHSLGTTAVSWMLHDEKAKAYVKSAVMLDPVTFLLINPGIAFNFIHRKPNSVLELLMHYFVSRELFIAHTLSRHFSWSHNCLFPELLPSSSSSSSFMPLTTIYLSEFDSIVPAVETYDYLKRQVGYNRDYDVKWMKGFQHGQMCLDWNVVNQVASDIHKRCFM